MRFFSPDTAAIRRKAAVALSVGALLTLTGSVGVALPFLGIFPGVGTATLWPWISLPFGLAFLAMGWSERREAAALDREKRLRNGRRSA
jgi:hypothetical protein